MERLIIERARRGLTRQELAKRSGVNAHTISDVERGLRQPRATTLARLAEALELDPEDLLGKAPAPPPPPFFKEDPAEGRRALYLATVLEEARDLTRQASWMRDFKDYGDTPEELTGWSWKVNSFLSSVWAQQGRWENHVFGPLKEQELPDWERNLLEQIKEALKNAESAARQARISIADRIEIREMGKQVAQWREESEQVGA